MIHHKCDVFLVKGIHRGSFGYNSADHGMVVFYGRLLVRSLWITVKDTRSLFAFGAHLNGGRIGEFASVVPQKYMEQPAEYVWPQNMPKFVEDVDNGLRRIGIPNEGQHELWHSKM